MAPGWLHLLEIIVAVIVVFILYFRWTFQYWKRRNMPYLDPVWPKIKQQLSLGEGIKLIYSTVKAKGLKHAGVYMFTIPMYFVVDLDYVKNILTRDFQYFTDRGTYYNEKDDPLSAHLFNIGGTKWRHLRTKLTPTFTSGKMKQMFQTLVDCQYSLKGAVEGYSTSKEPMDIKEVFARFTTDIIGSCAFGLECDSFKDINSPFRINGRKIFELDVMANIKVRLLFCYPKLGRLLGISELKKNVTDFFMGVVKDTIRYRRQSRYERNDFIQLLMDFSEDDQSGGTVLTLEEVAAQCFVFFIAGFETSSTTSTFLMYELAKNQDIQQKVRDEINRVLAKYQGQVTYEAINDMKYMNQVIDETLRIYPPGPLTLRECVKDYKVPGADVVIEKGTRVLIPISGIHSDPDIYPDPNRFDPERFTDQQKQQRHPYAHIPFGEGPRMCIGMRFGLIQIKVGLVCLIKNYNFTLNGKTKQPLKMDVNSLVQSVEGGVWLDVEKFFMNRPGSM